jgi:hypothetical protein
VNDKRRYGVELTRIFIEGPHAASKIARIVPGVGIICLETTGASPHGLSYIENTDGSLTFTGRSGDLASSLTIGPVAATP